MPHFEGNEIVDDSDTEMDFQMNDMSDLKQFRRDFGIDFKTLAEAEAQQWEHVGLWDEEDYPPPIPDTQQDAEEDPLLDLPLRFGPSRSSPFRLKSTAMDKKPKNFVRRENSRSTTKARNTNRKIKIEN